MIKPVESSEMCALCLKKPTACPERVVARAMVESRIDDFLQPGIGGSESGQFGDRLAGIKFNVRSEKNQVQS
jgi:hypothetical protein